MKRISRIFGCVLLTMCFLSVHAQTPLWQGKGRIAISSDGNEHDNDDWAATPLSLALLASQGLQNQMVLYTFCDHVWGSNHDWPTSPQGMNAYEHMHESALGAQKWFGFDQSRFICAVDNPETAYNALRDEINKSTQDNPLIIIAAGPMQVVGEAISRSNRDCLKYVTMVSHSFWNDIHADFPDAGDWDVHTGWTWNRIKTLYAPVLNGGLHCVHIVDQNHGKDYEGLMAPQEKFDWVKTSAARNDAHYKPGAWDWLYTRLQTCIKKGEIDASDAGLVIYVLTGQEKTDPAMARELMEHPK